MRVSLVANSVFFGAVQAVAQSAPANMTLYPAGEIQWKEGPASLPKGAKMAVA